MINKKKVLFVLGIIATLLFGCELYIAYNIDSEDIVAVFFLFCFSLVYVISIIISELYKRKTYCKVNNMSFNKNKEYFREILTKYSVAELSYIDGFELSYYNDVVAMLLKLEWLNVIKIENNKIVILDCSKLNLKESEKYLLNSIKNGHLDFLDNSMLKQIIENECIEDGLIEPIAKQGEDFDVRTYLNKTMMIIVPILLLAVVCLIVEVIYEPSYKLANGLIFFIEILFILAVVVVPIIGLIRFSIARGKNQVSYRLLDIGKDIYFKLNGLKNYIKDFSKLDEKEKEYIKLWDDYLIYSVMFGVNTQIPDKYVKVLKSRPDIPISDNSNKGIYFKK